jgi:hypothetical protein
MVLMAAAHRNAQRAEIHVVRPQTAEPGRFRKLLPQGLQRIPDEGQAFLPPFHDILEPPSTQEVALAGLAQVLAVLGASLVVVVQDVARVHVRDDVPEHPAIEEARGHVFAIRAEEQRALGVRPIQILRDGPAIRDDAAVVLDDGHLRVPAVENLADAGEGDRLDLVVQALVRQGITDAPDERAQRDTVREDDVVQAYRKTRLFVHGAEV